MTETMTSNDVRDALKSRWPDSEYLHIAEAPQGADRQGRKLDVLVLSQWASRGHELDGVEIKVSASDWKRELDNAKKADWWWHHCHRFWIAVPVALAPKVRAELPEAWGLLACNETSSKVIVKAPKHKAEPFTWQQTVGLLRAAADAGPNALFRAEERGRHQGIELGKAQAERGTTEGVSAQRLAALTEQLEGFTAATGIDLTDRSTWLVRDPERLARFVALFDRWGKDPAGMADQLRQHGERITSQARATTKNLGELAADLEALTAPTLLDESDVA